MTKKEKQLVEAFNNGTYVEVQFLIGWGARRKLDKEYLTSKGVDTDIERGTRDLLLSEDLEPKEALGKKYTEVQKYLNDWRRCLPSGIKSLDFVRKDRLPETLAYLRKTREEVQALAIAWADSIEGAKKRYKEKYPDKYNSAKYPSREDILNGVKLNWVVTDLTPPSVEKVGKEEAKRAVENAMNRINRAADIIVEGFVRDLANNLKKLKKGSEADGKINWRVIGTSKKLITLFKENLNVFVLNDQVKTLVNELDELIEDNDPNELAQLIRNDEGLKKVVNDISVNIMTELKSIDDAPIKRAIDF